MSVNGFSSLTLGVCLEARVQLLVIQTENMRKLIYNSHVQAGEWTAQDMFEQVILIKIISYLLSELRSKTVKFGGYLSKLRRQL